jgi:N6-adenosine-specific RNA methylase IME4
MTNVTWGGPLQAVTRKYDIVYADPPWFVTDFGTASARKHYPVMRNEELWALPVRNIMSDRAALFLWVTCPRLDVGIETIEKWGLHFRGVTFAWVKTRADGGIIFGKGVPPTFTKPNIEMVLAATTVRSGRPFPILSYNMPQVILSPTGKHSAKPRVFRDNLVSLCGDRPRIELFAREQMEGWDAWGNELPGTV